MAEGGQTQTRSREKEKPQRETEARKKISRSPKTDSMEFALQAVRAGMSPYDLPPETARLLASLLGNQEMLSLFGGGGGDLALGTEPNWEEPREALPVLEGEIRWPALTTPPPWGELGEERGSAFPADRLRPMGRRQVTEHQ